jgi:hypothetical protein
MSFGDREFGALEVRAFIVTHRACLTVYQQLAFSPRESRAAPCRPNATQQTLLEPLLLLF